MWNFVLFVLFSFDNQYVAFIQIINKFKTEVCSSILQVYNLIGNQLMFQKFYEPRYEQ